MSLVPDDVSKVLGDLSTLESERSNFDREFQTIADYVLPLRDFTIQRTVGDSRYSKIFDSTAPNALFELASNIHGLLINPATKWFGMATKNKDLNARDDVRVWLDDVTERMLSVFNSTTSNFHNESHSMLLDISAFGTGAIMPSKKILRTGTKEFRFQAIPLPQVLIRENDRGAVDTLQRKFMWTGRQALQYFGENVDGELVKIWKEKPDKTFTIVNDVRPSEERQTRLLGGKPWSSLWILREEKKRIREGGFYRFPYLVARWEKVAGEAYGRSPAMKVLPDTLMVNEMSKTVIRSAQKIVDPPLQVPDEGFLSTIRTRPAGINFYRSGTTDRIEPIATGGRPDIGEDMLERRREIIREGFFMHLFQVVPTDRQTATEFVGRKQEQFIALSPIIARIQAEFLGPAVEWLFEQMLGEGMFLPPPKVLSGEELDIEYVSPLALSQHASELSGINNTMAFAAQFAQLGSMDNFKLDDLNRHVSRLNNFPAKLLRKTEDVDAMREQQAQMAQKMQQAQAEQASGEADKVNAEAAKGIKDVLAG